MSDGCWRRSRTRAGRGCRRDRGALDGDARRAGGLVPHRGLQRSGAHPPRPPGPARLTRRGRETASVPLAGTPTAAPWPTRRSKSRTAPGPRVFAPVTNRGEAIGVLELDLAEAPDERTVADVALAAHALAYVVIANRRFTDSSNGASARSPSRWPPRSSTACCPAPTPARRASSPSRLAGAGRQRRRRHLRLRARTATPAPLDDRRDGPHARRGRAGDVLVGALRNARRAGLDLAEQAGWRTRRSSSYVEHGGVRDRAARPHGPARGSAAIVTPATRRRSACATAASSRWELKPTGRSAPSPAATMSALPLEPGDRLVFVTDGMLERNAPTVDMAVLAAAATSIRVRRCSTSSAPCWKPAAASSRTTPRSCASTGTAGPRGTRTTDAGADA